MSEPMPTLTHHVKKALKRSHARRPVSFYLLLGIIIVMILGTQLVYFRNDPKQFALYLSLMFVFFFVVGFRATLDFFDITRRHLREQQALYRNTLGEEEFASELGRRVAVGVVSKEALLATTASPADRDE